MSKNKKYRLLQPVLWWTNVLLGILLLISGAAGRTAPSHAPFIAIIGLVYPLLLIFQFLFLTGWILFRNIRFLLPLLLLAVSYPNIKDHIGFHCNTLEHEKSTIRLFTYNVRSFAGYKNNSAKNMKSVILHFAVDKKPDIICMQEYKTSNILPKIIRDNFKQGSYYFRDYLGNATVRNMGLVIISKYPSTGHGYLRLSPGRTFAIYSDLEIKKETFRLINVHLASISLNSNDLNLLSTPFEQATDTIKWTQWRKIYHKLVSAFLLHQKQMHKIVQAIQNSPFPVILCGDFNDTPSSYAYHQATALLHDTFTDKACLMKSTYAGPLPFLRIDHVFIPAQFQTNSYRRYNVQFSDHYAVGVGINFSTNNHH